MASQDHVQQRGRVAVSVSSPAVYRPQLKGPARPTFRSNVVRDLASILDLNQSVQSWSCGAAVLNVGRTKHIPDFQVEDADGSLWLLDAFDRKLPKEFGAIAEAADALSQRYRVVYRGEIYDGYRLKNANDLLRYAGHKVPLGDRVRLLSVLDEHGPLSLADCLRVVRETQPVAAVASLILHGFLDVELDEALIAPETMVRRIRR